MRPPLRAKIIPFPARPAARPAFPWRILALLLALLIAGQVLQAVAGGGVPH